MPRYLQPNESTQHRVAAIALYRALLSRCASTPLPDEDRTALRNAIRNKYRKNRKVQSAYQLGIVFRAGYEILDRFDDVTGSDLKGVNDLTSLISSLPQGLKCTTSVSPASPPPPHPSKKQLACLPPEKAVLNVRPYANVSGPRHVPILASANGVPFLRLTKPQPPALSRILRYKLERRIDRFHKRVLLNNYWAPIACQEDDWDAILERECGVSEDGMNRRAKWADVMIEALRQNVDAYERDMSWDKKIVSKMMRIVDEETDLALEEGQQVVRGRKRNPIRSRRPP